MQSLNLALRCMLLLPLVGLAFGAERILLWPDGAPGANGNSAEDKPELLLFPAPASGRVATGVVICPGGGYHNLAMSYEGTDVAAWFNKLGISAFVLKYRLGPRYHHPAQLEDAQRAIRYVRAHASDYGVDKERIGIMGFSAGGHLAATAGTHFDNGVADSNDEIERQSSRPNFLVLAYPVITMQDPYVHQGSRTNLLGDKPNPILVNELSNELQVTRGTPPTFLFHTTEDQTVAVENSVMFYLSLRRAGVPAEMHIYLQGRHGVGLAETNPVLKSWPGLLANWLAEAGFR